MDNGNISTALITIAGAILAVVIAQPQILEAFMGQFYVQYGAVIIAIMVTIYNLYFPRQPLPEAEEPQ